MKKVIALILTLLMMFSFVACSDKTDTDDVPTVSLDAEALKSDWTNGELHFPNGKSIKLPCSLTEFVEASGYIIGNQAMIENKVLAPDETVKVNVADAETETIIEVESRNNGDEDISCLDATVVKYNFNNTKPGNGKVTFVGTLTVGVARADIEKALGIPEGQTSEDTLYHYTGKNERNRRVELIISFNSDDIVNSVSYEVIYR